MRESGEPIEFGSFDFYKVFSRAFGEEGNWVGEVRVESGGMPSTTLDFANSQIQGILRMIEKYFLYKLFNHSLFNL